MDDCFLGNSDSEAEDNPFKVFHSIELNIQFDDFKVWDFELDETEVRHVYETGKQIFLFRNQMFLTGETNL